jgi:plastocyanin
MSVPRLLPLLAALAVFVTAGCGGSDPLDSEPVATTEVSLPKSYKFEPAVIEVEQGAKVTWTNDDNFTHTIRFDDEDETAELEPGDTFEHAFDEAGSFHYVCTLHPQDMEGEVRVGQ